MTRYHLDTSTIVTFLRGRSAALKAKLGQVAPLSLGTSQVVRAELLLGCRKSSRPEFHREWVDRFLAGMLIVDFDANAAEHYAEIRAELEAKGTPIGPNDLLIAAIARANGATLITVNEMEFRRVPGLVVENWCD